MNGDSGGPMFSERECLVVVGGHTTHFDRLARKIKERGFDAVHWREVNERSLPSNTAAVLICNDICTVPMQDRALASAKKFGTPVLYGSAVSWSGWTVQLDARKIVAKPAPPTALGLALQKGAEMMEKVIAKNQPVPVTVQEPKEETMVTNNTEPTKVGTPRNSTTRATRAVYMDWIHEALIADPQTTNRQLDAMLTKRSLETFGTTLKKFSDKMHTEARAELGIKSTSGRHRDPPTMEEKRAAVEKLAGAAPGAAVKTIPLSAVDAGDIRPLSSYSSLDSARTAKTLQDELGETIADKFNMPAWYTQDFRDALEMFCTELDKAGITNVTELDPKTKQGEYERPEIRRWKL